MKSKITRDDVAFSTVYSFLSKKWQRNFYDILIVDECSTISTKDIYAVLQKIDCSAVIFMGDIYQIESIKFGNWFEILREFLPKDSYVDLTKQHRTKNSILQNLWTSVRNLNISNVRASLSFNKISHELDEDVLVCLSSLADDESSQAERAKNAANKKMVMSRPFGKLRDLGAMKFFIKHPRL
jgi:hypothetical protein